MTRLELQNVGLISNFSAHYAIPGFDQKIRYTLSHSKCI